MNLLDQATETFTIIDKTTTSDGVGGYKTVWVDGASIQAASRLDNDPIERIAQAQTTQGAYTIITKKNITLGFHDVLRRERDKKIFRVTSDGADNKTPESANLNMRAVSAEEWVLPND